MTVRHRCSHQTACAACVKAGRTHWADRRAWHRTREERRGWLFVASLIVAVAVLIGGVLWIVALGGLEANR